MKNIGLKMLLLFPAIALMAVSLSAQETKVTVKVEKDGKTVKDTTYTFESAEDAHHAMQMMEIHTGDHEDMMKIHQEIMKEGGKETSSYVFVTSGGEEQKIKVVQGDSVVWITEDGPVEKHVVVKKSGEGDEWEIISGEEGDMEMEVEVEKDEDVEVIIVKKKVKKEKETSKKQ